ncbi:hypothetical protein DFO66_10443 [Brevibacterium sanguinis]|uniref:Uncharacterized protein n=2 Tax=Brevibacterium TaxID=1696 RepID=A0A366IIZ8_9MICO|nr:MULTISPECIES: hypothetical protein [Brevibacterium]RBP65460.1 hypothetical protein DFO66_10443 [Brevibacterium sanguinis]RBP72094.1 hypothetical protein DFO65_10449 [Brevibacterium celere]
MNDPRPQLEILLITDPGFPSRRLGGILDSLDERLNNDLEPDVHLTTRVETILMTPHYEIDHNSIEAAVDEYDHVDIILVLVEAPRHVNRRPLVAEVFADRRVAVVCATAVGAIRPNVRILDTLMSCIERMRPHFLRRDIRQPTLSFCRWSKNDESGAQMLSSSRAAGNVRLLMGMVAANDPWRTMPKLSGVLAGAAAAGAFGIFYSSIWQLASYLSTPRLLSIGLMTMVGMVLWLIASHRLWDVPPNESRASIVLLYNFSTILTLFACTLGLYIFLVVFIFLGSLVVIDSEYLGLTLDVDVSITNYLDIAWLSAALGVAAGALGSNFDSDVDVKRLTHGQRLRQRIATDSGQGSTD